MFLLFHLLTGLVIGYLLADRFDERRMVLPCILGSVLPDIVDKPIGYLVFGEAIGNGRIFLHTLFFLVLVLAIGAFVLRKWHVPHLLALGIGVGSHQVLDLMWEQHTEWYYPFLGPFSKLEHEEWFVQALLAELQNPVEWITGLLLCLVLLPIMFPSADRWLEERGGRSLRTLGLVAAPILFAVGIFMMTKGLSHQFTPVTGWHEPLYNVFGGGVVILAALAAYRFSQGGQAPGRMETDTGGHG